MQADLDAMEMMCSSETPAIVGNVKCKHGDRQLKQKNKRFGSAAKQTECRGK